MAELRRLLGLRRPGGWAPASKPGMVGIDLGVRLLRSPLWIGPVLVAGARLLIECTSGYQRFDSSPFR